MVSFYLDYLTETVAKNPLIMYIEAAALNGMKFCMDEEDLFDMFGMIGLDKSCAVICPLSDADDPGKTGSHWAFMLVLRQNTDSDIECFYFDSWSAALANVAVELVNKLKILMKATNKSDIKVHTVTNYPKQNNMYDCGVFSLLGSEVVMQELSNSVGKEAQDYNDAVERIKRGDCFTGKVS